MTLPEVVLWERLRTGRLAGRRFRRQHPIGRYIADFYCPTARLAVEVDSAAHANPQRVRRDGIRDGWFADQGILVLRFAAADVLNDDSLTGVLERIGAGVASRDEPPSRLRRPSPRFTGGEQGERSAHRFLGRGAGEGDREAAEGARSAAWHVEV